MICCLRNVAGIMDSIERRAIKNSFDVSRLFNKPAERATVYTRTETLNQEGRLVGCAYNALKEAFYSEYSSQLLLVDYDLLAQKSAQILHLIYHFWRNNWSTRIFKISNMMHQNLTRDST